MSKILSPFLILVILSIGIIAFFYGEIILSPNDYFFSGWGDGIKNYFTYAYHIKHDTTYINFEGMNYPYGEHLLYTDCHPMLSTIFKFCSSKFNFFDTYSVGILNSIMIFSILLTFIICYFLLVELGVNSWLSVFFAISITLMAPQIFRLGGHFSLSYSCAIPLSWLLFLKSLDGKKSLLLFLFVNILFWVFTHIYLGVMISSFLLLLLLIRFYNEKNNRGLVVKRLLFVLAVVSPLILFLICANNTDTHVDRTNNPAGFFEYNAELDDIFLPNEYSPLRPLLDRWTGNTINLKWEAWAYLGFSSTILFIFLFLLLLISLFKKRNFSLLLSFFNAPKLNEALIASFILLLFAFAFPFKQIPELLEYFPIIKQFRATGRFSWPFYFVAASFIAYMIQNIYYKFKQEGRFLFGILFVCIILACNLIESFPYHTKVSWEITRSPNLFNPSLVSQDYINAIKKIDSNNYQAIITLPFFHVGSENFSLPVNHDAFKSSIITSFYSGIPLICSNLSRTSIKESKKIIQLLSPAFYKKEIRNDFNNSKPVLVIKTPYILSEYERDLLNHAILIYSCDKFDLYRLDFDKLFYNVSNYIYTDFLKKQRTLFPSKGFLVSNPNSFLFYTSYEDSKSEIVFRGRGAYKSHKKGRNLLAEFNPNTFAEKKKYQIALWMYNGGLDALNHRLKLTIEECDVEKNISYKTSFFPEEAKVINGDWSLVEGEFKVNDSKNPVYITSEGRNSEKSWLYVDDLLIYEAGDTIYKLNNETRVLFYNNHAVKL